MSVIETLADWITRQSGSWSEIALSRAEHAFSDTIACMVAGSADAVSHKVSDAVRRWGAGSATIFGSDAKVAAPWAAMVNGTAAHVLEIDDNYYPALTHASAILVPALIALGEEIHADGHALLDAFIVGLEMHAFLGRGVNRSHYFAGWHPTATLGCIGTAAACARLMGLDKESIVAAMSLATSMASGNKAQFGTEAKSFQCGMGASNSIVAARLAAAGLTGNPEVLEDPQGFLALYGGSAPRGWDAPLHKLGGPLALEEFGLAPKRHACCGSAHNSIDCVLDLKRQYQFSADDVKSVDIVVGASNKKNLRYDEPVNEFQARFSMPYNIALALLKGSVTLADFEPESVWREEVRRLMPKVSMTAWRFEDEPRDPDQRPPHIVKIVLNDGRVLATERVYARGLIQDPFTKEERCAKIRECCEPRMDAADFVKLAELLDSLRKLRSIRDLTAYVGDVLCGASARAEGE
ncbi:mmgE/PrpD family protein [Burkholderia pseudomallei ABCPW 30]|uniref:MmgE/PrpD family protein n=1 Tax=Burkholderia pseudomallei TaxID=28450 RepID=UPI0005384F64|nr:MmgE/PrpD family protein [Burkholderia pseudomallei]KGV95682.1 mmgE/PrpD family protein [Burkholderia pseudomallei ABCPW 30]